MDSPEFLFELDWDAHRPLEQGFRFDAPFPEAGPSAPLKAIGIGSLGT